MHCIDSDSGLGRATPPRRAPSPGMGPGARHLPSPSGPGSLPPGLMTKRRIFDDGSSDISSTPSSMLEYSGWYFYVKKKIFVEKKYLLVKCIIKLLFCMSFCLILILKCLKKNI